MQDHQQPKPTKADINQLELAQLRRQLDDMHDAMRTLYQHIAVICRVSKWPSKLTAERLVQETHRMSANYAFLLACQKEEERLVHEAQTAAKATEPFTSNPNSNANETIKEGDSQQPTSS